jgi:hypothetical protein
VSLWPRRSVERENAALREEVKIYEQMIETYKAEQAEIKEVLKAK